MRQAFRSSVRRATAIPDISKFDEPDSPPKNSKFGHKIVAGFPRRFAVGVSAKRDENVDRQEFTIRQNLRANFR